MKKIFLVVLLLCGSLFALVDINSASKDELMSIKGIGDKTADLIIKQRDQKCFDSVDELTNIKGIGAKKVEGFKEVLEAKPCDKK